MAKEVNDKEKKVKKESTKKETTKKASNKKDAGKKDKKAGFFKEFKAELKRVSWPTLKQVVNNTFAVIAIVLIVCVTVFILDVIFESLNTYGVEKLKALVTSSSSETVDVETEIVEGENNEVSNEAETTDATQTETTVENVTADTTNEEATNTVENSVENN
ncbi:MAG: preprotein translocase subunit SecE [Clostridia bacterium]|nr:preprotein translocase subunit SecE [Clostridia bacterium]